MLTAPWNIILTVLFTFTGVYCLVLLFRHRSWREEGTSFDSSVIHFTHAVMSAAMIAMCWVMAFPDVANWAQIVLFSALALALVPGLWREPLVSRRVDLIGHIWLGAAMVWMIAAMPILMAGMSQDHGEVGEHTSGHGDAVAATPVWADLVNAAFVAGSLALTLWWLYRALTIRDQRLHAFSHCLMAGGMAAMLLLMNA